MIDPPQFSHFPTQTANVAASMLKLAETDPPPVKPGWKTTEFYLSLAAMLLTYLYASGLLTSSTALAIAGAAATVLTALGYKVSRTLVKTAGAMVLVIAIGASQSACSSWQPRERAAAGVGALIDCEADNLRSRVAELVPLAEQAVMAAISGDGRHVDSGPLRAAAQALRSDLGRCALASAVAILATPAKPAPGAAMAAGLEVDRGALLAAFEAVRGDLGGATYRTRAGVL